MMPFAPTLEVKIECYEGPLSVLITLIKRNKVSIWDISLSLITERFLEYVELAKEMDLRIAEDFIDMASLLIFIKSRMLLPSKAKELEDDPREMLVERIIEYEMVRGMAEGLRSLPLLYRDTFCKDNRPAGTDNRYDLLYLCKTFFELITNREERFITIKGVRPTLEEKIKALKEMLDTAGIFLWDIKETVEQAEKVATLLGMLELTKAKVAWIYQERPFGRIALKRREDSLYPHRLITRDDTMLSYETKTG